MNSEYQSQQKKEVVVLGAGVIGLTTAIVLLETGKYRVTIIADVFHDDSPKTTRYTSGWAGAHHVTICGSDTRLRDIDQATFEYMWKQSEPGQGSAEGCFMRLKQQELFTEAEEFVEGARGYYPNYREMTREELPAGVVRGEEFDTVTINVPQYLSYLQGRFLSKGGTLTRGTVQHINQILEGGPYIFHHDQKRCADLAGKVPIDALIICTGLGARTLGGVEDNDVFPTRGQTVVLNAPWIKTGWTQTGDEWTYIIPRNTGEVIVGAVREENDWYPLPRPETRLDILERGLALFPELAPPEVRKEREPTINDVLPLVINDYCGFRPSRKGGIRLEATELQGKDGRTVPIIFNYGHGGHGFISSWGCAFSVLEMISKTVSI